MNLPFAFWKVGVVVNVNPIFYVTDIFYPAYSMTESFSVTNPNGTSMTIVWSIDDVDSPGYFNTPSNTTLAAGQTKVVYVTRTDTAPNVATINGTWTCGADSGTTQPIELDAS